MRALNEGGREVFELISDSEPEAEGPDSDVEVVEALRHTSRSSSTIPSSDADDFYGANSESEAPGPVSPSDVEAENYDDSDLTESDTVWMDDGKSFLRTGKIRPTQKVTVHRMEYRDGLAAVYPIHRIRTGIVVDLNDEKYWLRDPTTKEVFSLNSIIFNADNDGWDWGGGGSRAKARVTFAPGEDAIDCRRISSTCKGAYACAVVRFELDPAPHNAIIAAQQETRRREGNTPEGRVILFVKIVRDVKCGAVDSNGNKCRGGPVLKPKPHGTSRGHQLFVGCSGWTLQQSHRTHSIPDQVDENLVANALGGRPLTDDPSKDTPACSGIIHPHIGLKKKACSHAHVVNGMQVQGQIRNYPCPATRSMYIPKDPSIRKVLVVHNETGHNHPMPALSKVSFALKDTYRECIEDYGILGATVAKVDNGMDCSSAINEMELDGKTPATHAPPLHNKRVKRDILHTEKIKKYPNGLGIDAIYLMYRAEELTKPFPELYIHSYIKTKNGEIIILTFVPYLLKLLDDPGVTSFDGDTTCLRCSRLYHRRERRFFEILFDKLQRIKREATGKPLPFKKFVPDGNLFVTNVDMDAAQVIGLCRSVLKLSDPEHSGIPKDTPPEQLPPDLQSLLERWKGVIFFPLPVHEFRSLVCPADFARLENFVYVDSKVSLDAFSSFVDDLGVKKIAVEISCRRTLSTTNTNEAQHHWTNSLTGIKLTPVEALERASSRRKVDHDVAREIKMCLETGILSNPNNELSHCMARNTQRHSSAIRKANESREAADISAELRLQIEAEAEKRRASNLKTRSLKAQLKPPKIHRGSGGSRVTFFPRARVDASKHRGHEQVICANTNSDTEIPVDTMQSDGPGSTAAAAPTLGSAELASDLPFDFLVTSAPSLPESSSVGLATDAAFEFLGDLNWNFDVPIGSSSLESSDIGGLFPVQDVPNGVLSTFDPTFLRLATDSWDTLIPSDGVEPFDDFLAFTMEPGFASIGPSDLPMVPRPAPESLPALSPAPEQTSEPGLSAPKVRRSRREVDEANILRSTRPRIPTERFAEDDDSTPAPKKGRESKILMYLAQLVPFGHYCVCVREARNIPGKCTGLEPKCRALEGMFRVWNVWVSRDYLSKPRMWCHILGLRVLM
ncbi:hypothetical protein K438DRAFT_2121651 [Mycena galopus ATCC 62051]|nr:hypothetical protein K438DRAFT_2121651 [Mycena galopus ATCC 62051]